MAEDPEKKDEEKLEFDTAGQILGYISLDQARVLALQHARENTDFYGEVYGQQELTWEELNSEESEDYYRVRLSYRPIRGFNGRSGVELFTIDKAGPIEFRQILQEPRTRPKFLLPVIAAGVAVLVAAVVGGFWSMGLQGQGTGVSSSLPRPADTVAATALITVSIQNQNTVTLVSPDGSVTVDVSAGSVDDAAQLTYRPLVASDIPVLPAQYQATEKTFDLTTDTTLLKPSLLQWP